MKKLVNLALSGGGIRGIAHVGAYDALIQKGYEIGNVCGVSAGALVGTLVAAGYSVDELKNHIYNFPFEQIILKEITRRYPIINDYIYYRNKFRMSGMWRFLNRGKKMDESLEYKGRERNIFSNIIKYSQEDYIMDSEYLEEWVYNMLKHKGIYTFEDLQGGLSNKNNKLGYKVKMTAVDVTRGKIVVLPDDLGFYGIKSDQFEVYRAVMMTMAVPFVFRPIKLIKKDDLGQNKTYYLVDGGVLDNFPVWLVGGYNDIPVFGLKIYDRDKNKILNPLNILKTFVSFVHDIGKPCVNISNLKVQNIDVTGVDFLDFSLNSKQKLLLYESGKKSGMKF